MHSFSQIEDEALDSEIIIKNLRKLGNAAEDFLDHIVPDDGDSISDLHNLQKMHTPDSRFFKEYQEFDRELNEYVKDFKGQIQDYITLHNIHHALFDRDGDTDVAKTGLDLILYLANLVVFAKRMVHPDLNQKDIWNALRQLDLSFPSYFVSSFSEEGPAFGGESALLKKTFKLALEMRTQLAIMVLQRSLGDSSFDPDRVLSDVFFDLDASQESERPAIRGWSDAALGEGSPLSQRFQNAVLKRIEAIRKYFPMDVGSLERGEKVLIHELIARFPWDGEEGIIVQLLGWTRLRYGELRSAIEKLGGAAAIVRNVKRERENHQLATESTRAGLIPQETLRRKRSSFGPDRRRSSRRFNPNAPVDLRAIEALKARERASEVQAEAGALPNIPVDPVTQQPAEETRQDEPVSEDGEDDWQTTLAEDDLQVQKQLEKEAEEPVEEISVSGPPKIGLDLVRDLIAVSQPEKENRAKLRIFDRQPNAQRVDFGDGFSSQVTTEPSNPAMDPKVREAPSRKRARPIDDEEDEESDAFETSDRTVHAEQRRQLAPATKKVRVEPPSSTAPPSHQPPRRSPQNPPAEEEESRSETSAPDMTEEAPASSKYHAQQCLARQNATLINSQHERKPRMGWTQEAEEAFIIYMGKFPQKYATIQLYDESEEGFGVLGGRSQVSLKDKAVTMAVNMIK